MDSKIHKYNYEEDSCNVVQEPLRSFGGAWTEKKLDAFEKYVRAYLTIMRNYAQKYGWELFYFDAFAGSGTRTNEEEKALPPDAASLFPDEDWGGMEIEETYKGAAERALNCNVEGFGFDFYYFVDKSKVSLEKLEVKLKNLYPNKKMGFRLGDANQQLLNLVKYSKENPKSAALILIDPFGMQLDWTTIEALKDIRHIDLWILIPSGVIINRLLKKDGELMFPYKLARFFGIDEKEIKNYFYTTKVEQTLFGEETNIEKGKDTIAKIVNLYLERLKTIFSFVIDEPLVLKNSTNCPIFHFVFASHNETGKKIASEIVGKKNRML